MPVEPAIRRASVVFPEQLVPTTAMRDISGKAKDQAAPESALGGSDEIQSEM